MLPIVLIHGYSSEGKNTKAEEIYGNLPRDLRATFGDGSVVEIDLARWISLNDGIAVDDVSFALNRALTSNRHRHLLNSGFHVAIHSTGALVVRNWIRLFSAKPSPIANLVHLAGANFGSGLAHIGRGQLARWGRLIFQGVDRGMRVLNELEFGSSKTLDLHHHFLTSGNDMFDDYEVQEFCIIGSQTVRRLRLVPIRYVKEDSSDNTVRTCAGNLNFNYIRVEPNEAAQHLTHAAINAIVERRMGNERLVEANYRIDPGALAAARRQVPFTVVYETAHSGADIGIVDGDKNRTRVLPHVTRALSTAPDSNAYDKVADAFQRNTERTMRRAANLSRSATDWNKQAQYEGHAQLVFRLRDQYGVDVDNHDITFKSRGSGTHSVEHMIEDVHKNRLHPGTVTFYLRTQKYSAAHGFEDLFDDCRRLDIEITGEEPQTDDIRYLPLTIEWSKANVPRMLQSFRTTFVDVTLLRLPSRNVLKLTRSTT